MKLPTIENTQPIRNPISIKISDQINHSTVRLECTLNNGTSTGTGFFYVFRIKDSNVTVPVIVTNKHVVEDSIHGKFYLTEGCFIDGVIHPVVGSIKEVNLPNFSSRFISHPDPKVDLAILPIAAILNTLEQSGFYPFTVNLCEENIPTDDVMQHLSGLEDIVMAGYPNGVWDKINNMPILRKGMTATDPKYDYNGKAEFLIDCACFPGSSGSPVLIANENIYSTSQGIAFGSRLHFLGILYAGPQHIAQGELKTIDSPLNQTTIALSRIPNNLGFVIKAKQVMGFQKLIETLVINEQEFKALQTT